MYRRELFLPILYLLDSTEQENKSLFLCSRATEYSPVKFETSHTVTLPSTVVVIWLQGNLTIGGRITVRQTS